MEQIAELDCRLALQFVPLILSPEDLRRELRQKPSDNSVSDRSAVNVAPLQLGEDVLCVHSARFNEALVTAAILRVSA